MFSRRVPPPPPAFKETPSNWNQASPQDQLPKGKWWEIYRDQRAEHAGGENRGLESKSEGRVSRVHERARSGSTGSFAAVSYCFGSVIRLANSAIEEPADLYRDDQESIQRHVLQADLSYEIDLWGQVRRTIESSRENAQASAGDLENVSLSLHSELALDYFSLRGLDLQKQLLDATVIDFEKALHLTQVRYRGGVASNVDVSQAETQLETRELEDIETGVQGRNWSMPSQC